MTADQSRLSLVLAAFCAEICGTLTSILVSVNAAPKFHSSDIETLSPSLRLHVSAIAPCSDAWTALCGGKHWVRTSVHYNVLIVVSTEAPSCHQSSLTPQTLPTSITHTLTNTHMLMYWHLCWGRSGVYTSGVCQSNHTYCSVSPRLCSLHLRRTLLRIQTCNSSSSDIQLSLYSAEDTISGSWCTEYQSCMSNM